jgi:hypothetical protein
MNNLFEINCGIRAKKRKGGMEKEDPFCERRLPLFYFWSKKSEDRINYENDNQELFVEIKISKTLETVLKPHFRQKILMSKKSVSPQTKFPTVIVLLTFLQKERKKKTLIATFLFDFIFMASKF